MSNSNTYEKFKLKHLPQLMWEAAKAWNKDDPWRLSAVVAYYAVLSLPGLLLIVIYLLGFFFGTDAVQGKIVTELSEVIGFEAANYIQDMIIDFDRDDQNIFFTIAGIAVLLFGATGVFYQLQISINKVWHLKPSPDAGFLKLLFDRARSFGFILVIAFLLLVSFIITAGISALQDFIQANLPDVLVNFVFIFNTALSITIVSLLFALIFKFLPDAKIKWSTVIIAAIITAILFTLGKVLLAFYFGKTNPGSAYGAAGSVILILLWVSYSCMILFYGAELSYLFAKRYGYGIEPTSLAVVVKEEIITIKKGKDDA